MARDARGLQAQYPNGINRTTGAQTVSGSSSIAWDIDDYGGFDGQRGTGDIVCEFGGNIGAFYLTLASTVL